MIDLTTQYLSRTFVLPVPLFRYLKRFQQALIARTGRELDNSQTLASLIEEHQAHIGTSAQGEKR